MKIKSRNEVLNDIIRDSKKYSKGWKATFGKDKNLFSNDYYLFHPDTGIYLIKEHLKNPFERKGMGAKIARKIDDDIGERLNKNTGDFGIIQGNINKIIQNLQRGITPEKIFDEALKGRDLGISIPVKGVASSSADTFTFIQNSLLEKQKKLDFKFEKMMNQDGIYNLYS
jgi:hypothetical protein